MDSQQSHNSYGFGLIEVMVAMGIMTVVSLAGLQIVVTMMKAIENSRITADYISLQGTIEATLRSPNSCAKGLRHPNDAARPARINVADTSINGERQVDLYRPMTGVPTPADLIAARNLKLNGFKIDSLTIRVNNTVPIDDVDLYSATLTMKASHTKSEFKFREWTKDFYVRTNGAASVRPVEGCSQDALQYPPVCNDGLLRWNGRVWLCDRIAASQDCYVTPDAIAHNCRRGYVVTGYDCTSANGSGCSTSQMTIRCCRF